MFFLTVPYICYYKRSYVTVSGQIIYNEFEKGDIEVYWTPSLNNGPPKIGELLYLQKPGFYMFKLPKNYGNIYLCARNRGDVHESFAYFISEPIRIGSKDISRYNLILKTNKLLINDYKGETVNISGRVICSYFRDGTIDVCVYRPDYFRKVRLPPDIAKVTLPRPGDFTIKVPKDIGEICLLAINIPQGERNGNSPLCLRGSYANNPLVIKETDISGIEIIINDR